MPKPKGRNLPVSPFRRLVTDLMYFSKNVPCVCMDRTMHLARVRAVRQNCLPRPCWTAIFTKAFAIVAERVPELRQTYMSFPWSHIYEHPYSSATLNIERQWGDETVVFQAQVRRPESRTMHDLSELIRYYKEEPVEKVKCFRRIMRMAKVPWPFRRLSWWVGLNLTSRLRMHNFGTFGLSTTASHGAGIMKLTPILTATLHYSLFDEEDRLQMRLSFDHRVLDGATAAHSLLTMENVLNTEILSELSGMRQLKAA